ncbi:MAG: quinoprotein dehydrogenase-associated putative ABC transporter substrate-binding protein [Rhizobiales bacterium]|nr:quinoprotein dehydrogenase-associated putative ABC transporter substrate-binding protein [Hyphomicrobiales bacterium]
MSLPWARAVLAILVAVALPGAGEVRALRVCADPDNLPFSNAAGQGFENRIVAIVAKELGAALTYTWTPQWRGFVRKTLDAGTCDVVAGVPAGIHRLRTTKPYYVSTYAVVQPASASAIASFDDGRLAHARIGVQLVGEDGANTPPMDALAHRGLTGNVRGFMVYGDGSGAARLEPIMRAVAEGDVDVAFVWGPVAGYFASRESAALRVTPMPPDAGAHLAFPIAMGVRKGDAALAAEIDSAIAARRAEIAEVLDAYDVPRLSLAQSVVARPEP